MDETMIMGNIEAHARIKRLRDLNKLLVKRNDVTVMKSGVTE